MHKKIVLLTLLSSFLIQVKGQIIDTVYYNKKWEKTSISSERYYYSVIYHDTIVNNYKAVDYYPSGKIQMKGEYLSMNPKIKNGQFEWYYPNEIIKLKQLYRNDTLLITESFNDEGKSMGRILKEYYINSLSAEEKAKMGLVIRKVDVPAKFPGGKDKLISYIQSNTHYPAYAKSNKIEGKVQISFIVTEEGNIKNIKIVNASEIHKCLQDEAIRLIESMPKWEPAISEGKKVESLSILSINFAL